MYLVAIPNTVFTPKPRTTFILDISQMFRGNVNSRDKVHKDYQLFDLPSIIILKAAKATY